MGLVRGCRLAHVAVVRYGRLLARLCQPDDSQSVIRLTQTDVKDLCQPVERYLVEQLTQTASAPYSAFCPERNDTELTLRTLMAKAWVPPSVGASLRRWVVGNAHLEQHASSLRRPAVLILAVHSDHLDRVPTPDCRNRLNMPRSSGGSVRFKWLRRGGRRGRRRRWQRPWCQGARGCRCWRGETGARHLP